MITIATCLLGFLAADAGTPEPPPTRLYVRTVPPGASVMLEGKLLGKSDELFTVTPGTQTVLVEVDGYVPEERRIEIAAGEITRAEFRLKKRNKAGQLATPPGSKSLTTPSSKDQDGPKARTSVSPTIIPPGDAIGQPATVSQPATAAAAFIEQLEAASPLKKAAATVLRQHAEGSRWSGRAEATLFAVAAERLPTGRFRSVSLPAMLKLSTAEAVNELMQAKSLLARYEDQGLSDATTLRRAVVQVAGRLDVVGSVQGLMHQAGDQGDYAVAFVSAGEDAIIAYLFHPTALTLVKAAYRDVMHQQARQLMQQGKWQDALGFWRHLHQRKLVSPLLYVDAARCFKELGQPEEVVRLVGEALAAFQTEGDWEFFERAGELVLDIKDDSAQALAERAYTAASQKFGQREASVFEPLPPERVGNQRN